MGKFEQLQEILGVRNNRQALDRLDHRLTDLAERTGDVADVLPAALKAADERGTLAASLTQPVKRAIHESVGANPKVFADVLFPVMGPAIRRSIAEALKGFVDGLNRAMEQRMSPRAIGWRLEAWKTGVPYREVVLSHTLQYRVRLVFLIHRDSGLLIHHAGERRKGDIDEDAFSAMLTAIQDFIRDSTDEGNDESALSSAELGEYTVWIVSGFAARLALVIDGHPPLSLRTQLTERLEEIHTQQGMWLNRFDGSQSISDELVEVVDSCILAEEKSVEKTAVNPGIWLLAALFLGALAWGSWGYYERYQKIQILNGIDAAFAAEPGVILIRRYSEDDTWVLEGLADPLARQPAELAASLNLPAPPVLNFSPYYGADPVLEVARMKRALSPLPAVEFEIDSGQIRIFGQASPEWASRLEVLIARDADPARFDTSGLKLDLDWLVQRIAQLLELPDTATLTPDSGGLVLAGSGPANLVVQLNKALLQYPEVALDLQGYRDEIELAIEKLNELLRPVQILFIDGLDPDSDTSAALDELSSGIVSILQPLGSEFSVLIRIQGLTDTTGRQGLNFQLRGARANWVLEQLVARGVPASVLVAEAAQTVAGEDRSWRRVEFKVRSLGDE